MKYLKIAAVLVLSLICMMPTVAESKPKAALVSATEQNESVSFNTKTLKYHALACRWARKCTKSCVVISLSEAKRRGGVPCKVCGGS